MTLCVPYNRFAETAARLGVEDVYLALSEGVVELTATFDKGSRILYCKTSKSVEVVRSELRAASLELFEGSWLPKPPTIAVPTDLEAFSGFIAAVSYQSRSAVPGLWVDAYPTLPSQAQVLKGLYDEFRDTGELVDTAFEEFVRLAQPNVVIVPPGDIHGYLAKKGDPTPEASPT